MQSKIQSKFSQNSTKMEPKFSQNSAKIQSKCSQNGDKMQSKIQPKFSQFLEFSVLFCLLLPVSLFRPSSFKLHIFHPRYLSHFHVVTLCANQVSYFKIVMLKCKMSLYNLIEYVPIFVQNWFVSHKQEVYSCPPSRYC